jgi:hypothetical protein
VATLPALAPSGAQRTQILRIEERAAQKYGPLTERLRRVPEDQQAVTLTFAEVAACVGGLPARAYGLRQWWIEDTRRQGRCWRAAGWRVDLGGIDLDRQTVSFTRVPTVGFRSRRC